MNRRGFMRTIGGVVAGAMGFVLMPKRSEPRYICTERHVRFHWSDGLVHDTVFIDDAPNPKYTGPTAMERLMAYCDEPRDRLNALVAKLIKPNADYRPLDIYTQKVNWHGSTES